MNDFATTDGCISGEMLQDRPDVITGGGGRGGRWGELTDILLAGSRSGCLSSGGINESTSLCVPAHQCWLLIKAVCQRGLTFKAPLRRTHLMVVAAARVSLGEQLKHTPPFAEASPHTATLSPA